MGVCVLRSRFTNFVAFESTFAHLNFHVTAGELRSLISVTGACKNIYLLQSVQTSSEGHPPLYAKINGPLFLGLSRTGLEADHSSPSIGQVKKRELMFLWRVQEQLYLVRTYSYL